MHQTLCYGLANASQKGKDVAKLATSKQKIMTKSNQTVLFLFNHITNDNNILTEKQCGILESRYKN